MTSVLPSLKPHVIALSALLFALFLPATSPAQSISDAPPSKVLSFNWQGQQTGYWCGPGSTRIALTTRLSSPPTQTTLANYMGTTVNGTDHIGLVVSALNHYMGVSVYSGRNMDWTPTSAQRSALKQALVATISNGYPLVANVISGWRPPGYPGGTIYHYVSVVGYDQSGDRALIADPAGQCSGGSAWCNVPSSYWVTTYDLGTWIGGKGYAGTSLPIKPATPDEGTLIGAIYQNGSTGNRVSGALVKVGTRSITTGSDGLYEFSLPPGSYTASVTKSGYSSASVTRTVVSGGQAWGSMEINAQATTGTIKGKIYERNPADASDTSRAISGAIVKTGAKTVTTGADGIYTFSLPPGSHTVSVTKSGYVQNSVTRTVTANTVIWGSVALSQAVTADTQAPQIELGFPANDADLEFAIFDLQGTVTDDRGTISSVDVSLNGGAVTAVPVSAGKFSIELKVAPGSNTIRVAAKDAAGNAGSKSVQVIFHAGVKGSVHLVESEERVEGARVVLTRSADGALLGEAIVDAETGAFTLPLSDVPVTALLTVSAEGFHTWREELSIPDDRRLEFSVGLTPGQDQEGSQIGIEFSAPASGSTVDTDTVTVRGLAVGFEVAGVTLNDVAAPFTQSGHFEAEVALSPGENVITAVATGTEGQSVSGSITIIRADRSSSDPEIGDPLPGKTTTAGGCGAVAGTELALFALLSLLPALRRRRFRG